MNKKQNSKQKIQKLAENDARPERAIQPTELLNDTLRRIFGCELTGASTTGSPSSLAFRCSSGWRRSSARHWLMQASTSMRSTPSIPTPALETAASAVWPPAIWMPRPAWTTR